MEATVIETSIYPEANLTNIQFRESFRESNYFALKSPVFELRKLHLFKYHSQKFPFINKIERDLKKWKELDDRNINSDQELILNEIKDIFKSHQIVDSNISAQISVENELILAKKTEISNYIIIIDPDDLQIYLGFSGRGTGKSYLKKLGEEFNSLTDLVTEFLNGK